MAEIASSVDKAGVTLSGLYSKEIVSKDCAVVALSQVIVSSSWRGAAVGARMLSEDARNVQINFSTGV